MTNEVSKPKDNGKIALLTQLASSGDNWVKLGIMVMIGLSGFGNWLATWHSSDSNRAEIVQGQERIRAEVIRQVQDIHNWIQSSTEEFHRGNEDSAANKKILMKFKNDLDDFESRQMKILENQGKMLEINNVLVTQTRDIAVKLQELKRLDQMRSAPQ
jgi:hypothetical protein